jgi:hypothetical protein
MTMFLFVLSKFIDGRFFKMPVAVSTMCITTGQILDSNNACFTGIYIKSFFKCVKKIKKIQFLCG